MVFFSSAFFYSFSSLSFVVIEGKSKFFFKSSCMWMRLWHSFLSFYIEKAVMFWTLEPGGLDTECRMLNNNSRDSLKAFDDIMRIFWMFYWEFFVFTALWNHFYYMTRQTPSLSLFIQMEFLRVLSLNTLSRHDQKNPQIQFFHHCSPTQNFN